MSSLPDKAARKQSEKETKTRQKAYDRAVKAREKLIKQRDKLIEKHYRQQEKAAAKAAAAAAAARPPPPSNPPLPFAREAGGGGGVAPADGKEKKPRKFCALPRKRNGEVDTAWVAVFMEGVDEVGAHCGLFFPGPHYEKLVGDVGERIVGWVHEDLSRRAVAEMQGFALSFDA
ncbi:hypothetical protein jhhlp_002478 [Lomentospora prolificans]|uniref:Uncharacterized protein n=1 Tax=Lomentospora prolificans TaxID=41688 RepID=A0A2N3NE84_9PEZI|nr:hypothetical protein jhhlp_002478 [Lomentospora prolificans]